MNTVRSSNRVKEQRRLMQMATPDFIDQNNANELDDKVSNKSSFLNNFGSAVNNIHIGELASMSQLGSSGKIQLS